MHLELPFKKSPTINYLLLCQSHNVVRWNFSLTFPLPLLRYPPLLLHPWNLGLGFFRPFFPFAGNQHNTSLFLAWIGGKWRPQEPSFVRVRPAATDLHQVLKSSSQKPSSWFASQRQYIMCSVVRMSNRRGREGYERNRRASEIELGRIWNRWQQHWNSLLRSYARCEFWELWNSW